MSRQIAPALVSSAKDLVQYYVADASAVDPSNTDGFIERSIHSEIYKKYPAVQSVIHSHAETVIPYGISGVPLQPCFHVAGFLGTSTPVFDISKYYTSNDTHDMLVKDNRLGEALATYFSNSSTEAGSLDHNVVLMRSHGMTVIATNIEECVLRSIYTQQNAAIQTTALTIRSTYSSSSLPEVRFLNAEEANAAAKLSKSSPGRSPRPWELWVKEVEQAGLYTNHAK
ncbi:hypothetical protein B7463_g2508, partial [Scytalidium lignicola]